MEEAEGHKLVSLAGHKWLDRHPIAVCPAVFDGKPARLFLIESENDLQACCCQIPDQCQDEPKYMTVGDFLNENSGMPTLPRMDPVRLAQRPDEESEWIVLVHEDYDD